MTWTIWTGRNGPVWSGFDSLYNPHHAKRWIFVRLGVGLIVIHFVLVWSFAGLTYAYLTADDVDALALKSLKFVFLPGVASLVYAGWFCRKYLNRLWRLEARFGDLVYSRPQHWLKTKLAEWCNDSILFSIMLSLTVGMVAEVLGYDADGDGSSAGWSATIAAIARVETSATADWEPDRQGFTGDNAVSRDEVQAFLFMNDGSRHVIASVHAGREDMAKLTHSIRSWVEQQRQDERLAITERIDIATLQFGEGYCV